MNHEIHKELLKGAESYAEILSDPALPKYALVEHHFRAMQSRNFARLVWIFLLAVADYVLAAVLIWNDHRVSGWMFATAAILGSMLGIFGWYLYLGTLRFNALVVLAMEKKEGDARLQEALDVFGKYPERLKELREEK